MPSYIDPGPGASIKLVGPPPSFWEVRCSGCRGPPAEGGRVFHQRQPPLRSVGVLVSAGRRPPERGVPTGTCTPGAARKADFHWVWWAGGTVPAEKNWHTARQAPGQRPGCHVPLLSPLPRPAKHNYTLPDQAALQAEGAMGRFWQKERVAASLE